jgi:hypothetical protein
MPDFDLTTFIAPIFKLARDERIQSLVLVRDHIVMMTDLSVYRITAGGPGPSDFRVEQIGFH